MKSATLFRGVRRPAPWADKFAPTQTALAVMRLCAHCQDRRSIGLVYGEAGVGKTTAFNQFRADADAADGVCVVTMTAATESLAGAIHAIAAAAVVYLPRGGLHARWDYLVNGLAERRRPLLILDEAQHLSDRALDAVRQINDEARIGIVLGGNYTFPTRFNGRRGAARFAQLDSRISRRRDLPAPTPGDVTAMCDHFGVKDAKVREYFAAFVNRTGNLRELEHLARDLWDYAGAMDHAALQRLLDMRGDTP